jgi:hypothetical protein
MNSRRLPATLAAAALIVCVSLLALREWPREAWFGGDTWEYHSMGVNFARGHGLVAGLREPLDDYHFGNPTAAPRMMEQFAETGRDPKSYHTYRTPAYPLFLGLVYRLTSPLPERAAQAQVCLLVLMAFALPLAGRWAAGRTGLWAGALAGVGLLATGWEMAIGLMTEPLIVLHLFLCFLAFHAARRNRSTARLILWGLAAGVAPLVKGSMVFLPGLAFLLEVLLWPRHRDRRVLPNLAFLAALGLPLVLWSAYISRVEGRPVFLSTQGNSVLLEGNNELVLLDGAWHPEYAHPQPFWAADGRDTSGLYYNQPDVRVKSIPAQLAGFFARHWKDAPRLFLNKFNRALRTLRALQGAGRHRAVARAGGPAAASARGGCETTRAARPAARLRLRPAIPPSVLRRDRRLGRGRNPRGRARRLETRLAASARSLHGHRLRELHPHHPHDLRSAPLRAGARPRCCCTPPAWWSCTPPRSRLRTNPVKGDKSVAPPPDPCPLSPDPCSCAASPDSCMTTPPATATPPCCAR